MNSRDKNECIDLLKGISCIIVVWLHCRLPGIVGDAVIYTMRFSVPLFFMVSGYFCFYKNEEWIHKKILSTLKLLLYSESFYALWGMAQKAFGLLEGQIWTIDSVPKVIQTVFFGTMFNGTLWYLYAIFWTWILLYFLKKKKLVNKCYILIPILIVIHIVGRLWCQNNADIDLYVFLFRSAFLFGVPFVLLGHFIAEYKERLLVFFNTTKSILLVAFGGLIIVVEYFVVGQYMDLQFSTVFVATGMFLWAINQRECKWLVARPFVYIGARLYMWIYVVQIFVKDVVDIVGSRLGLSENSVFLLLKPFIVLALCVLVAQLCEGIKRIKKLSDLPK